MCVMSRFIPHLITFSTEFFDSSISIPMYDSILPGIYPSYNLVCCAFQDCKIQSINTNEQAYSQHHEETTLIQLIRINE